MRAIETQSAKARGLAPSALVVAGAQLVVVLVSACALAVSPMVAIIGAPLSFGGTDALSASMLGAPHSRSSGLPAADRGPRLRVRIVSRALGALLWAVALWVTSLMRASPRVASHISWLLPLTAIVAAMAVMIGTWGSSGIAFGSGARGRGPAAEGPVIGLLDVSTTAWALLLSLLAHDAPLRVRVVLTLALATALLGRTLLVTTLARLGARSPMSPTLAVIGFVGWLGAAGVTCTLSSTAIAWSGLGAALVLVVASILAELRRKRPVVALLRATLGCAVATMVAAISMLLA